MVGNHAIQPGHTGVQCREASREHARWKTQMASADHGPEGREARLESWGLQQKVVTWVDLSPLHETVLRSL